MADIICPELTFYIFRRKGEDPFDTLVSRQAVVRHKSHTWEVEMYEKVASEPSVEGAGWSCKAWILTRET